MANPQQAYGIRVSVTLDGSAYRKAKIWAIDITRDGTTASSEDHTFARTDTNGQCIIDVANITSAYANGDTVRIYCKVGEILTYSDITLNTNARSASVTFTIVRRSGLTDGMTDTLDADGKHGFNNTRGLKRGLKDAMM